MCQGKAHVVYPPLSPWRGQRKGRLAMPWRHAQSRVGQCLAPRRERQGKGQSLPSRMDLWLRPRMEQGRHCRASCRERQGKGQPMPLRLGLWLRPRRAQGRHCRAPCREIQDKGQPLAPRLGLWLRPRRAQGRRRALLRRSRGGVHFTWPVRRGRGRGILSLSRRCVAGTCLILPGRIINRHIHLGGWTTIKGINQDINTFKVGGVEGPPAPVVTVQSPLPQTRPPLRPLTLHQKVKVRVHCAGG